MVRIVVLVVVFLALLGAGLAYLALPKEVFAAAVVGLWLILTVALSLVGDRRYQAAYGDTSASSEVSRAAPRLGIGRAILIGELVVNVPVVGLLVGIIAAVGPLLEYVFGSPRVTVIMAVTIAFAAAWSWWSFATPRWLIWAMRRVTDPLALKNAAVGSILWPDHGWGRFFNRTQWRSTEMEKEEKDLIAMSRHRTQAEAKRRRRS
jgi:hypothetical protein